MTATLVALSGSTRIAPGVASEPVPAVVGSAIIGRMGVALSIMPMNSRTGLPPGRLRQRALARSILLPPPRAMT
ncbi:hypothetical protein D3C87_1153040 [compost metagenome]